MYNCITCDQEKSGFFELLQEDDTLSAMTTSQDDKNGAGRDGLAERNFLDFALDTLLNLWSSCYEFWLNL